jgi:uncharacterized protein GlcG (DUF336 family)
MEATMLKQILTTGALAVALTFAAADGFAQGATPAPLAKVVVSGRAAERMATHTQINADTARAIVDACIAEAKQAGNPVSVFILAPDGDIVESYVRDGETPNNWETGLMKGQTALYTRAPTRELMERYANNPAPNVVRLKLGARRGLSFFANAGGLPIIVEGQLIGAIGVGGLPGNGELTDERCAHNAFEKVLGPQPPLGGQ